ncbi:MAG: hypothetical protein JXA90_11410, partial [Planctomycetes bacterium]|nr:hypothetical protein [Planctomycetota bacterium]
MRLLTTLLTIGIVAFWIAMNTAYIRRQIEISEQGRYERGVVSFLGHDLRRERWMAIYRKGERMYRRIGYTGLTLEKIFGDQSVEYHATVETVVRGKFPLPL